MKLFRLDGAIGPSVDLSCISSSSWCNKNMNEGQIPCLSVAVSLGTHINGHGWIGMGWGSITHNCRRCGRKGSCLIAHLVAH